MAPRKESTPEELANSRDARVAERHLDQHERYLALLRQAQHHQLSHFGSEALAETIKYGEAELSRLRALAGGRIVSRRRPKKQADPTYTCTVYMDECGQHSLTSNDPFAAFVLAGVIIPDDDYPRIDRQWKQWKAETLGSPNKNMHEPDVRRGNGSFWFGGNIVEQSKARESLRQVLTDLEFAAIACVINRPEYVQEIGVQALDDSLPTHPYLMTLDFLMERLVMVLENQFSSARARIVAEARGPLEDALFQREYARLLLDGTSYISSAWFRQQLAPGIEFKSKDDNIAGLELADLLARPYGEKALNPSSTPDR